MSEPRADPNQRQISRLDPSLGPRSGAEPGSRIPLGRRIHVRILLAFVTVAVCAVLMTTVVHNLLASRVIRENVAQRNLQIATIAASKVSLYFRSSLSDLRALGQVVLPIKDPWILDAMLENSVTIHRQFGWISLVDPNGVVVASSQLDNRASTAPGDLVRRTLEGSRESLSEVQLPSDGSLSVHVAIPSDQSVASGGVLVAELLLREVWDQVDGIVIGESGRAMVVAADGTLIAHPDKTRILSRKLDTQVRETALGSTRLGRVREVRADDGTPILVAAAEVEGQLEGVDPWYVVVVQDLADASVPQGEMLAATAMALLGFLAVALGASVLTARMFSTPLARLLGGTERIRAGDLTHRIRIHAEDEIGRLSRSFNAMVQDLEERSRKLEGSEKRYRLLTESLTDLIFSLDPLGHIVYSNPQSRAVLGMEPEELVGRTSLGLLTVAGPDGLPREEPGELTVTTRDGRAVVLEVRLVRAEAPETGVAYYGVARDITERKIAEARLEQYQEELRNLALQVSLTAARERKRIAAEIHDRIGQALALTRIKLGQLTSVTLNQEAADMVSDAMPLLEQVIQDTRSLIFSVSSPLLYELGLSAALEQLVEQFSVRHPVAFRYVEEAPLPSLETDTAVLLFDTVKELLVNVVKHARATHVFVTSTVPNGRLRLEVRDDGVGFDTEKPRDGGGYGLFSVRERLESMRGNLVVDACPGGGTRITLEIPLV